MAFPVFTKVLEIESRDAALFGLMIQSVGMTMASLFIVSRRIPFYADIYRWAAAGGCLGVIPATLLLRIPAPFPKLLFSCLIFAFGLVLCWMTWKPARSGRSAIARGSHGHRLHLFATGLGGGVLASQLGSGADMVLFIVMIVAYGLKPKRAIPTTVLTMATVSLAGFAAKWIAQPEQIRGVWEYWAACVPVVAVGAPLGALVLSRLPPRRILLWVLALITAEVGSTVLVIGFTAGRTAFVAATLALAGLWVLALHRCHGRAPAASTPE